MDRRGFIGGVAAAVGAVGYAGRVWAQDAPAGWAEQLRAPRRHLIMRHALAPGCGDPDAFELRDCSTQRNLDERGREQARRTGAQLRAAGVKIDQLLSSQWCRCLDTAELLGMGSVQEAVSLNSFFQNRGRSETQTAATKVYLLGLEPEISSFMVTHQVNITALLDVFPSSGEVFLIEIREGDGAAAVLDSFIAPA